MLRTVFAAGTRRPEEWAIKEGCKSTAGFVQIRKALYKFSLKKRRV